MATKKVSAKTVVAEKPVKATKAAPAVKAEATEKVVKATTKKAAPAAEKNTVKAPAVKAEATEKVVKATAKKAAPAVEKNTAKAPAIAKVTFSLPKEAVENAETVAVLGDFNNWQEGVLLKKQKDGSFQATVELEKGRSYEYRFLINGNTWENAWNAEAYKPTPFGVFNSVVSA